MNPDKANAARAQSPTGRLARVLQHPAMVATLFLWAAACSFLLRGGSIWQQAGAIVLAGTDLVVFCLLFPGAASWLSWLPF